ncbi:uncharacterized protein LOC132736720 [Ruditapes philippinarum]|uniref:uncharacterized protein LOC132736720 n=1 Tax=Ruditapes philippinarum TaxID=129788 RepID=UPI00295B73F3|nr:uncharacterized protein LOC132736720 [Ruditapes philippinarum]XP_060579900.1 uncharacterized protein LOC132736720 [Ruditapes philippinarum]
MEEKLVLALVVVCMLAIAHAQYTAIDQEWLMDDPHKADRLPIWSRLLGNGGFRFNQRASTRFPTYNTKTTSGNSANNWIQKLQNMYNIYVLRQLLGNNMATTTTTTVAPPTLGVKTSKATNNPWLNSLRNFYTMAVWNQFLSNQTGSNKNAK